MKREDRYLRVLNRLRRRLTVEYDHAGHSHRWHRIENCYAQIRAAFFAEYRAA